MRTHALALALLFLYAIVAGMLVRRDGSHYTGGIEMSMSSPAVTLPRAIPLEVGQVEDLPIAFLVTVDKPTVIEGSMSDDGRRELICVDHVCSQSVSLAAGERAEIAREPGQINWTMRYLEVMRIKDVEKDTLAIIRPSERTDH